MTNTNEAYAKLFSHLHQAEAMAAKGEYGKEIVALLMAKRLLDTLFRERVDEAEGLLESTWPGEN